MGAKKLELVGPAVFPNSPDVFLQKFAQGSRIFRQGAADNDFFIIKEGIVGIFIVKNNTVTQITQLGPGATFGEFALLADKKRSASARAMSDVVLYKVTEKGFNDLLAQLPEWAVSMFRNLVFRIRELDQERK